MTIWKTLVALLLAAVAAAAQAVPTSTLYLTFNNSAGGLNLALVQGNTITLVPYAYETGGNYEIPIAVDGDIRTTGFFSGGQGGQYTLSGTPTGTTYTNPGFEAYDGTTDGTYNYVVDYSDGRVIRADRDFQNPVTLFNVGPGYLGITYDPTNDSLWLSPWYVGNDVINFSMGGTVLSSFDAGHSFSSALALDHADNSLWLVNANIGVLEQFSKTGALLNSGPNVGYTLGGEFDLQSVNNVPEPATALLVGSALLLLGRQRRPAAIGR